MINRHLGEQQKLLSTLTSVSYPIYVTYMKMNNRRYAVSITSLKSDCK